VSAHYWFQGTLLRFSLNPPVVFYIRCAVIAARKHQHITKSCISTAFYLPKAACVQFFMPNKLHQAVEAAAGTSSTTRPSGLSSSAPQELLLLRRDR